MSWKRMRFQKKNKVWAKQTDAGDLFLQNDKALIKYQLDQPHQYWIHPDQLGELDESEARVSEDVSIAEKAPKKTKSATVSHTESTIESYPKNVIVIYTDGASSGNPGPAGVGVVLQYGDKTKEISLYVGEATNNIAELTAIKLALESLKRHDLPVYLHTDSSYAIGVLSQNWKPKLNLDLIAQIKKEVQKLKEIHFIKVKGHSGNPLNERADELATKSISDRTEVWKKG